jgi:hypothetical protein
MEIFKPTFLYIKRHTKTGLLYFGKTISNDVMNYTGSGTYWLRHIKKHGEEHIETLWYCLFLDRETIRNFAINFSMNNSIHKSKQWANIILENGTDGGYSGVPASQSTRDKMSKAKLGNIRSNETIDKWRKSMVGQKRDLKTKEKMRLSKIGRIHITDGIITKTVFKDSEEYLILINAGWKVGNAPRTIPLSQSARENIGKANVGIHWLTNSKINKRVFPDTEEYDLLLSNGYRRGFTKDTTSL